MTESSAPPSSGDYQGKSVAARWPGYLADLKARKRNIIPLPFLTEVLRLEPGSKRFAVLALPWEPGGETPFCIAQAAARHGANPLCVFPSWSPYWDGTLNVRRPVELPEAVDYPGMTEQGDGTGLVIIDQFSRLHWDSVVTHADREPIANQAGRDILALSSRARTPVLVIARRKGKGPHMLAQDLRSDGALLYDADAVVMADPDHTTGTATVHILKDRGSPAPVVASVDWPVLPRTVYRRPEDRP